MSVQEVNGRVIIFVCLAEFHFDVKAFRLLMTMSS